MGIRILKGIAGVVVRLLIWIRIINKEGLKELTGTILISNHQSNWDAVLLYLIAKPKLRFMAKEELFQKPLLGKILKKMGAFSVSRGQTDISSMKTATQILKSGGTLGLFPEGTRSKTGELLPFHPGVAVIALRTGAPIRLIGFKKKPRIFSRCRIAVGEAFYLKDLPGVKLSDTASVRGAAELLREKMLELKQVSFGD